MTRPGQDGVTRFDADYDKLQDEFNTGDIPTVKEFAEAKGIPYDTLRKMVKRSLREEFQSDVQEMARQILVEKRGEDVAQLMERHLNLTECLERHVVQALGLENDPAENMRLPSPDDADQAARLARVLLETFRLQRTIYGEPEQVVEQQGGTQIALGLRVVVDRAGELVKAHPELLAALPAEEPVEPDG